MAPAITDALTDRATPEDVVFLLLRLVRDGALAQCLHAVHTIVEDPERSAHDMVYAIAAIAEAGTHLDKQRTVLQLLAREVLEEEVSDRAVSVFYPGVLSAEEFVLLVAKTQLSARSSSPHFPDRAGRLIRGSAPKDHLEPLLTGLFALLKRMPGVTTENGRVSYLVSREFLWITPILSSVVARTLSSNSISDILEDKVVDALIIIGLAEYCDRPMESRKIDLQQPSVSHLGIRRQYCWKTGDENTCQQPGKRPHIFDVFNHLSPLEISEIDSTWMLDDISPNHPEGHRLIALGWVSDCFRHFGTPKTLRADVWNRIKDSRVLRRFFGQMFPNASMRWLTRSKIRIEHYAKWGHKCHRQKLMKWFRRQRNSMWFWCHTGKLREGSNLWNLVHLYEIGMRQRDDFGEEMLVAISNYYSPAVSAAFREGCKAFWRNYAPPLRHERAKPNELPYGIIIGQTGLRFEVTDGLDFATLSPAEAELAVRYAAEESNAFPDWLPDLARFHPAPFKDVLISCISADWSVAEPDTMQSDVLWRFYDVSPRLQELMASDLLALLQSRDPCTPKLLLQVVAVILRGMPQAETQIIALAGTRMPDVALESPVLAPWLVIWLWLDVNAALEWLERTNAATPIETMDAVFRSLGSWMVDQIRFVTPTDRAPAYYQSDALRQLIRLFYLHIRPEDDIDRAGTGTYTPTARDHAQGFRVDLVSRLVNLPGQAAHDAILQLADDPALTRHRAYLLRCAASRRRLDAEPDPWKPGDAWKFASTFDLPVRSGHDLFAATFRRLRVLRDDLQDADFRRREGLPIDGNEDRLQEWLARYLDDSAKDQYAVHREVLVANNKMPDLRLDTPPHPPTSIEVKWADDWSYRELSTALSDQLVGLYMRARRSRHGILLLGWRGKKQHWQGPNREAFSFQEMVEKLGEEAKDILGDRWDIDNLEIFSLKFGR